MGISPERLRELAAEGGDAIRDELARIRGGDAVSEDPTPTDAQPPPSPPPDEADVSLTVGESDVLTLHPQDADGNPIPADQLGATVEWSEDSGGFVLSLSASADGLSCTVIALAAGTAHVTAALGDVWDEATFTVQAAAPPAPPSPPAPVVADLGLEAGAPYPTPGGGAAPAGATEVPPGAQVPGAPGGTVQGEPQPTPS